MMRKNIFTVVLALLFIAAMAVFAQFYQINNCGYNGVSNNTKNSSVATIRERWDNRAFATIITPNEKNLALAVAQNLVQVKSKYPLLILILDHYNNVTVSSDYIRRAKLLNAKPIILEKAPMAQTVKISIESFKIAWNKLSAWKQLVDYTRVALMDTDMLVLSNIDELLDMPDISFVMGTCDPCEEPWGLSGGLMVFEPSVQTFEKLMNLSREYRSHNWHESEQLLIKEYYTTKAPEKMHVLSRIYNANVNSCNCMPKRAWDFMKILHWMCDGTTGKPYHWTREKILADLNKPDTSARKRCVHGYNLKWLDNYERALEYTNSQN